VSGAWRPKNYSGKFYGPTRLRYGLAKSRNMIAIRLLDNIGIKYTINYMKKFGILSEKLPRDLTLALGSGEITPINLAKSYAHFSNGGYSIEPYLIEQVRTRDGVIIYVENPIRVCGSPCDYMSLDTLQFPYADSIKEIAELRKIAGLPRFARQTLDPRNGRSVQNQFGGHDQIMEILFHYEKDQAELIGLESNSVSFLDNDTVLKAIEEKKASIKAYRTIKKYTQTRETELFAMIKNGCQPSDGKMFKVLEKLV
jgi:membrane carboxypeptidase/penicillin-binding protein